VRIVHCRAEAANERAGGYGGQHATFDEPLEQIDVLTKAGLRSTCAMTILCPRCCNCPNAPSTPTALKMWRLYEQPRTAAQREPA